MAKAKNTAKVNFTAGRIDLHSCPAGSSGAYLWDSTQPGLGLRARASGSKTYIFQRRLNNEIIRIKIGSPDVWGIDQAREEAGRLSRLIDTGIDPRERAKEETQAKAKTKAASIQEAEAAEREQTRAGVTLGKAWDAYLNANWHYWGDRHRKNHLWAMQAPGSHYKRGNGVTIAGPLYVLYNKPLASLTSKLLGKLLRNEAEKRPTALAQAYRILRAFLKWCDEQPKYNGLANPANLLNKEVKRMVPASKARKVSLQKEQLALWFDAVKKINDPSQSAYVQFLLLTGARSNEAKTLRWQDIDFQWRTINIHDKVEGERTIPLTPYLAQLLNSLQRRNKWVFSSARPSTTGHINEANHALTRAMQLAGLPHIAPHDLRRSFGTLSEWVECPMGVVAQIQGHAPSALIERHYRVRSIDLLRMWHTKIEGWILEQAGITQPSEYQKLGLREVGQK
jgi:integrase